MSGRAEKDEGRVITDGVGEMDRNKLIVKRFQAGIAFILRTVGSRPLAAAWRYIGEGRSGWKTFSEERGCRSCGRISLDEGRAMRWGEKWMNQQGLVIGVDYMDKKEEKVI